MNSSKQAEDRREYMRNYHKIRNRIDKKYREKKIEIAKKYYQRRKELKKQL